MIGKLLKAAAAWITIKKVFALGTAALAAGLTVKRLKRAQTS
jgi:hypothetical protein